MNAPADVEKSLGCVVRWLSLHRGAHSVLVHPHTQAGGLKDHTDHAIWLGPQLPLVLAALQ
jgi:aromatic ring-cleaving dioxygenase